MDGFSLVVLIHMPLIALLGAAWWSIGRTNPRAVLPSFIAARLARDSVAELLPFSQVGGFAAGIHVLSLTGIPARTGARSLFADLLMEFFAKLPYAIAGLALLIWLRPGSAVPSYLLLTLAVLIGRASSGMALARCAFASGPAMPPSLGRRQNRNIRFAFFACPGRCRAKRPVACTLLGVGRAGSLGDLAPDGNIR